MIPGMWAEADGLVKRQTDLIDGVELRQRDPQRRYALLRKQLVAALRELPFAVDALHRDPRLAGKGAPQVINAVVETGGSAAKTGVDRTRGARHRRWDRLADGHRDRTCRAAHRRWLLMLLRARLRHARDAADTTCQHRRSEEHTAELPSHIRHSYAGFLLKKKNRQ